MSMSRQQIEEDVRRDTMYLNLDYRSANFMREYYSMTEEEQDAVRHMISLHADVNGEVKIIYDRMPASVRKTISRKKKVVSIAPFISATFVEDKPKNRNSKLLAFPAVL